MPRTRAIATRPRRKTKVVAFTVSEETARDAEEAAWAAGAAARKTLLIDAETRRRIARIVPPDDVLDRISEGVALLDKGKANWTAADQARAAALRSERTRAAAVRAAGRALAASLAAMTPAEIEALDVTDPALWP